MNVCRISAFAWSAGALLLIACAQQPQGAVFDFHRVGPPGPVGSRPLIAGRWRARFTCIGPCAPNGSVSGTFDLTGQRHTVPLDSLLGYALEPRLYGWDRPDSLFFHLGSTASHSGVWVEAGKLSADSAEGRWSCSGYCLERGTVVLRRLK